MRRRSRGGQTDYRTIDAHRAAQIAARAVPLALGSFSLAAALAGSLVYLVMAWAHKVPLLAMTACTHGAVVLLAVISGMVTVSTRGTISAGRLELRSADAVRRNLLVLWNLSVLMTCLGWLAFGAGVAIGPKSIGSLPTVVEIVVPALLIGYNGVVTVLLSRSLRL